MPKILIVDDEPNIHYSFEKILPDSYHLLSAHSAEEALNVFSRENPDVVVMDVKLPAMDGLEALQKMKKLDARTPVIMMTAFGTVNTAITAMKYGAYEYLLKPFDVNRMRQVIEQALESSDLMRRQVVVASEGGLEDEEGDLIVGSSEVMQQIYKLIGQVAHQDIPVLICGESGTGKELVARAIYHHSKRAHQPFLEINCAALPETLLESELFGHEKGAFTGATEKRIGKFELVNGGTLFLDEIGELSLSSQAKLLRVLQYGTFTRIGGKEVIHTDVRVLVATNRNLKEEIKNGNFREDLYYRLNVITINLPPLDERREDIPELAHYFLKRYGKESGKQLKGFTKEAMNQLVNHHWKGNVRQLENCIRRAIVLARGSTITPRDLELEETTSPTHQLTEQEDEAALDRILDHIVSGENNFNLWETVEKLLIIKALKKSRGNQVQAAKILGIHRNTLRNRLQKYNLDPTDYNSA